MTSSVLRKLYRDVSYPLPFLYFFLKNTNSASSLPAKLGNGILKASSNAVIKALK